MQLICSHLARKPPIFDGIDQSIVDLTWRHKKKLNAMYQTSTRVQGCGSGIALACRGPTSPIFSHVLGWAHHGPGSNQHARSMAHCPGSTWGGGAGAKGLAVDPK
jgi:hypothetical protein